MKISKLFKNRVRRSEKSQELNVKNSSWLSVIMLFIILLLTTTTVLCKDTLMLSAEETFYHNSAFVPQTATPKSSTATIVKVSKRTIRTSIVSSPAFQFMTETGFKMLLLSFQPKEIYYMSDSLETTIKTDSGLSSNTSTQLLSGYTISSEFEPLGLRKGTTWASIGKIIAEYGTLGLKGFSGEDSNKNTLISSIIETDFQGKNINTSNVELLNGLAYRSNVITNELINRSLIYVPKYAAVFDNTLTKDKSYWAYIKGDNCVNYMAPFMYSLLNKQLIIGLCPNARSGSSVLDSMTNCTQNYQALAESMKTAFSATASYTEKLKHAQHIQNAIAFAWPVIVNETENATENFGPLMVDNQSGDTHNISLGFINPSISGNISNSKYWKSPFISSMYYVEDTLHKKSNSEAGYDEYVADTIDTHLANSGYKELTMALDEKKLHTNLSDYFKSNIEMAYATLDAVFGGIEEYPIVINPGMAPTSDDVSDRLYLYRFTVGHTESIDLSTPLMQWLEAGLDNYTGGESVATVKSWLSSGDTTKVELANKIIFKTAGIRQAQLSCALAAVLQERHPGINVDTQSNIEIRIMDAFTNKGGIDFSVAAGSTYGKDVINKIKQYGWGAWDVIHGLPNTGYCSTFETLASNFYSYGEMASNRTKITTLASASVMYAYNHKFGIPTTDGKGIIVGGDAVKPRSENPNDIVIDTLNVLGNRKLYAELGYLNSDYVNQVTGSYTDSAGIDVMYPKAFNSKKATANLALTDTLRQMYMCALYGRATAPTGAVDLIFNYRGFMNVGFGRDIASTLQTTITGFNTGIGQLGIVLAQQGNDVKYYSLNLTNKIGMSKYSISFEPKLPANKSHYQFLQVPLGGASINLSSSRLAAPVGMYKDETGKDLHTTWTDSQLGETTAGSFVIRTGFASNGNVEYLIIHPTVNDENTTFQLIGGEHLNSVYSAKLNKNQPTSTYQTTLDRLHIYNPAAANLYKMAFLTYSPTADTISKLSIDLDETQLTNIANNTTCATGYFYFLYNHTYYQKSNTAEIHAVFGFRDKDSTELEIKHECEPTKTYDHDMVLGINLSKETLEALSEVLTEDEKTKAYITVALGGAASGRFSYLEYDKKSLKLSKFDTSLLITTADGKETNFLANDGFGQLKLLNRTMSSDVISDIIKTQNYVSWNNRAEAAKSSDKYAIQSLSTKSTDSTGYTTTLVLTKSQVDKALKELEDPTAYKSDTKFMFTVAKWSANLFAGEKNERLGTIESVDKLATDTTYTFGVECQLAVISDAEGTSKSAELKEVAVYNTNKLATDTNYYVTLGSGLYSGLYGTVAPDVDDKDVKVMLIRDKKLYPNNVSNQTEYFETATKLGEGTDNHVYFKFSSPEIKQWRFTGKASLSWEGAPDTKLVTKLWQYGQPTPTIGYDITSVMNIKYNGGSTSVKEFYDTCKSEKIEYIIVSIGEDADNTEKSLEPAEKTSKSGNDLKGKQSKLTDSTGMTDALNKFNQGSMVYTLDEFVKLLGGAESENTNGNVQITDMYKNTAANGFVANDPDNNLDDSEATAAEFDANRLEFSFIASVYGVGAHNSLANAVKQDEREVSTYLSSIVQLNSVPLFDLTNGLGYILNGMTESELKNPTGNVRYNVAMAKELSNLKLKNPDEIIASTSTFLYELLAENNGLVVWTHTQGDQGSGYQLERADVLEGENLKDKAFSTIKLGDHLKDNGDAWVAAICAALTPPPPPAESLVIRTSSPVSYTQVKNGSWTNTSKSKQEWNTLTGLPSTEKFYISSGGSEFIIEMTVADLLHERAYRQYISHFAGNDCKFKPGDVAQAGGGSITSKTKTGASHTLNDATTSETLTDYFTLPEPEGYSSRNVAVSAHGGNTIFANWKGSIANTTGNPGIQHTTSPVDMMGALATASPVDVKTTGNGYTFSTSVGPGGWFSGYPGEMTNEKHPNKQNLAGTAGGTYSWDVAKYNENINQAYAWAYALEQASKGSGNVIITANSDQKVRSWHIGEAVITVSLQHVNDVTNSDAKVTFAHEGTGFGGAMTKEFYTTNVLSTNNGQGTGAILKSNDDGLSSGWFEVYGSKEQFWGAGSCNSSLGQITGQTGRAQTSWGDETALNTWQSQGHPQQIPYSYISTYAEAHKAAGGEEACGGDSCTAVVTNATYPEEFWCSNNPGSWEDATHSHSTSSETVDGHPSGEECTCFDGNVTSCGGHGEGEECHCFDGNVTECSGTHVEYSCEHEIVAGKAANTHTCSASHSASGYIATKLAQSPTVTYEIKVTFKNSFTQGDQKVSTSGGYYPQHSCCGPCCSHVLPAISDEWVQWVSYSTTRITDIRVNKISRSYVEGQNDITLTQKEDDYLVGNIKQGDVNIFYNIATENSTYRASIYDHHGGYFDQGGGHAASASYSCFPEDTMVIDGASLAGRVRYSLQAQQHDKVLWREKNQLSEVKRTNECDGQDSTTIKAGKTISSGKYNPSPDGGAGHEEWWALGILYYRSNSASDKYYVSTAKEEKQYNQKFTHANDWLEGSGDGKFNTAVIQATAKKTAYTTNSVDAVDKATWEYERFIERRNTINDICVLTDTLILQGTQNGDYKIIYEACTAAGLTTEQDCKRDEHGLKLTLDVVFPDIDPNAEQETYLYEGQGPDVAEDIPYDKKIDISSASSVPFGGYNGRGSNEELENHAVLGTSSRITTKYDHDGKEYDVTITHTDDKATVSGPLSYATITTSDDSTNPEVFKASAALYEKRIARPKLSLRIGQLDIQIDPTTQNQLYKTEKSTQTWFQILTYTEPNAKKEGSYDYTIGVEYYAPNSTIGGAETFAQESYYYGNTNTGYLTPDYKVNDIIIHTPISSINNHLLKDKDFYDQRYDTVNLSNIDSTKNCPGTSLLCEYSYLDCTYLEEKVLFNMPFDSTYTRVDTNGNITTGKAFTVDTYGYITSLTETTNYIVVPVKTGLVSRVSSGTYGSGITVNGTTINIPLNTIGAQYTTGTQIKLAMQGNFSNNTTIFECGEIKATMTATGIKVEKGNVAAYLFPFANATSYHNYEFIIDYDGLDKMELKVDGSNINKSASTPKPDDINVQYNEKTWSNIIRIGERCTLYNIQITHLPGTKKCTDGCYNIQFQCQTRANYTCDEVTKFTGTQLPHKFTAKIAGTYLIELYDGAGDYQSKKITLSKGQSIYAYLGTKGYWSYSGTDKGSTSKEGKTYVDRQIGVKDATIKNPGTAIVNKTTGTGSVLLKPGIYYLEAYGEASNTSGYYTVKNNTTLYYSVGNESWINTANNNSNCLVNSGINAVPATPNTTHTHTSSCAKNITNWSRSAISGYTAITAYYYESGSHCSCGSGWSTYRYYGTTQGSSNIGSYCVGGGTCYNGCTTGYGHSGSSGTETLYVKYTYSCNNLPLNSGSTSAVPGKSGYTASTIENPRVTSLTTNTTAGGAVSVISAGANSAGTGTKFTIGTYDKSTRLTTLDNAGATQNYSEAYESSGYYGYYYVNKSGSNNRYYSGTRTYMFETAQPTYGGAISMTFRTTYLTSSCQLSDFKAILVDKNGNTITNTINNLASQGYIKNRYAYSDTGGYTAYPYPQNILSGGNTGYNTWTNLNFAFELSDNVKMTGFTVYASTNSRPGDSYSAYHYAGKTTAPVTKGVKIIQYVDLSTYEDITDIVTTYTDSTENISEYVIPSSTTVSSKTDSGNIALTPGIYYLEATDEDGKSSSGIYHTLTNTTLYYGNGSGTHWINASNSASSALVYAKRGTAAVPGAHAHTSSCAKSITAWSKSARSGYTAITAYSYTSGSHCSCGSGYSTTRYFGTAPYYSDIGHESAGYGSCYNGCTTGSGHGGYEGTLTLYVKYTYSCNNLPLNTAGTPAVPGTYSTNNVKRPVTGSASSSTAGTRIIRLANFAGHTNIANVTYDTPTNSTVSNVIITKAVACKKIAKCTVTSLTEIEVPTQYTNYKYTADTSKIILSNIAGKPLVFEYTGNVQAVTLEPGTYKLEAWGASGGQSGGVPGTAGQGGYTSGTVTFDKTTKLYIYVGEQGNGSVHGQYGKATFNGGGAGFRNGADSITHNGTSGGGATDIRILDGVWSDIDSLKSRILVAGGGGGTGCASSHNPGHGGGLTGATTLNSSGTYAGASASGGSQTAPGKGVGVYAASHGIGEGAFGKGATGEQCAAGGGGGYYGGGTEYTAGGGGGSSYVSGYTGCDTTYLANQKVDGKNLVFKDVVLQQGGNVGHGRVRITKVEKQVGANAGASGDHIINSTSTTTTSCPVESPYYWFVMGADTNVAQIRLIHNTHTSECSKEVNVNNFHTHTEECIGDTPAYNYLINQAANNASNLDSLCLKYLGVSKSTFTSVYSALMNKTIAYDKIPATVNGHDNPILKCYNHNTEHVHTVTCSTTNKVSICNNIHHNGKHYDIGHPLCYEPCRDDEKHFPTKINVEGEDIYIGSAVNLGGYFTVYWDNYGDFYDTGKKGSLEPSDEKGQGYKNNMDTTRWLKRKVIVFNDIDVLFYNETTDEWTLHLAGNPIELPIVSDGEAKNGDDDEKRDWKDKNQVPITVYPFYCLTNNNEYSKTAYQAWTEALNSPSSAGQGDKPYDKDKERHYDSTAVDTNFFRNDFQSDPPFSSLHSTLHYHQFDVVGQIGNMIITYTTDPRWSNFFKQANPSAGWQVENLLYEVNVDEQVRYLYIGREEKGTFKDIRNHKLNEANGFLDTWNTEPWKATAVPINSILTPDLMAAQTSYTWSKLAEELKCGYDIYCEITTTGDYNKIEAEYKYYVLDKETGEVSEVDLWSKVDSSYLAYYLTDEDAIQIQQVIEQDSLKGFYGIESVDSLALYHLYVDLAVEQGLRMVTPEQVNTTAFLSRELDKTTEVVDIEQVNADGKLVKIPMLQEVEGRGISLESLNIGTAYGVSVNYKTRLLVGSSYDNWGLRDYSKGLTKFTYPRKIMDTNTGNEINQNEFTTQVRRWLFTAGLAENTVAVKFDGTTHVDLTTQSTHPNIITDTDRYTILVGVNIKARGDVWFLKYHAYKSPQSVLNVSLDTKYPDIIAAYGLSSKEDDFDVKQSH